MRQEDNEPLKDADSKPLSTAQNNQRSESTNQQSTGPSVTCNHLSHTIMSHAL